jgi:hypothetical protein
MRYTHDNDDDPLPFIRLAAATANVMAFLEATKQKKKDTDDDAAGNGSEQSKTADHHEAVDQKLKDLRTFERRAAGLIPHRRKT